MAVSDTNILENILNIGRRRERIIYYRKDGVPTLPLPADAYSRMYYLAKGFTTKPPGSGVKQEARDGVACPLCDFTAKDAFGLKSHLSKHIGKSNKEEKQ